MAKRGRTLKIKIYRNEKDEEEFKRRRMNGKIGARCKNTRQEMGKE